MNGIVIESVRTLASVCADKMQSEKDRLSAAETLASLPDIFTSEVLLVKREVNSVRDSLVSIQRDSMTTAKGKVKAANLCIRIEALISKAQ